MTPLGDPNRPKIDPSRLLNPYFFQKVDFQENERHRGREHDFDPKTAPKTTQDRPKTAPRRSSRASFFDFVFIIDFGPSWVTFWHHLGSIWGWFSGVQDAFSGHLGAPEIHQKFAYVVPLGGVGTGSPHCPFGACGGGSGGPWIALKGAPREGLALRGDAPWAS